MGQAGVAGKGGRAKGWISSTAGGVGRRATGGHASRDASRDASRNAARDAARDDACSATPDAVQAHAGARVHSATSAAAVLGGRRGGEGRDEEIEV